MARERWTPPWIGASAEEEEVGPCSHYCSGVCSVLLRGRFFVILESWFSSLKLLTLVFHPWFLRELPPNAARKCPPDNHTSFPRFVTLTRNSRFSSVKQKVSSTPIQFYVCYVFEIPCFSSRSGSKLSYTISSRNTPSAPSITYSLHEHPRRML